MAQLFCEHGVIVHVYCPRCEVYFLKQENEKLRKALESIVGWGSIGGSYSDIAAASTFQRIAKEALEGK